MQLFAKDENGVEIPFEVFEYCEEHLRVFLGNFFRADVGIRDSGNGLPKGFTRLEWSRNAEVVLAQYEDA